MNNLKPGVNTSEFWITLSTTIVGILVMVGVVSPSESNNFNQALTAVIGGIIMVIPAIVYIVNRSWLKSKAMNLPTSTDPTATATNTTAIIGDSGITN